MTENPKLHIPQPTARPGEAPDFSYIDISEAGEVERPPIDSAVADIESLATRMVRVLDDNHEARGPWAPDLDADTLLKALETMVLTRAYDDRMLRVQRQGKISFYMQALGEEAVSVGQGLAFDRTDAVHKVRDIVGIFQGLRGPARLKDESIVGRLEPVGVLRDSGQFAAERPKVLEGPIQTAAEAGRIDRVLIGKGKLDGIRANAGENVIRGRQWQCCVGHLDSPPGTACLPVVP